MTTETRKIVRLMGRDLPGEVSIENALRHLQGVNFMLARAVRVRSGFDENIQIGDLDDAQMETLSKILENPGNFGIPAWLMNRRNDIYSGENSHVIESDLIMTKREDLERMKKMRAFQIITGKFDFIKEFKTIM